METKGEISVEKSVDADENGMKKLPITAKSGRSDFAVVRSWLCVEVLALILEQFDDDFCSSFFITYNLEFSAR